VVGQDDNRGLWSHGQQLPDGSVELAIDRADGASQRLPGVCVVARRGRIVVHPEVMAYRVALAKEDGEAVPLFASEQVFGDGEPVVKGDLHFFQGIGGPVGADAKLLKIGDPVISNAADLVPELARVDE
jgi:hypothetical protein